jgi:hypothetical protein
MPNRPPGYDAPMVWYAFVLIAAVLLIGAYAVVRLRGHETDSVAERPARESGPAD